MSAWDLYQSTLADPWDLRRVVHLHRRVIFGASRSEIERDLADGPHAAVTRILDGTVRSEGVPDHFEDLSGIIGLSAVDSASLDRLRAWWLYRCLYSPDPLRERLTLMWHNHFATSNVKVNDIRLMKLQNETIRASAFGPFSNLLRAMSHDPALLIWLDAPLNKAGIPNENLAREMMELFALGTGHYQEIDVREAARALTGCTVRNASFQMNDEMHDVTDKTILNRTGSWNVNDFIDILLEQDAAAERLAWRLITEFFGENVVDAAATEELSQGLREHGLDIRWGMETILRSQLFFSNANIQSRISDPVSFLLMPLRALECWRSALSTLVLAEWLGRLGQALFEPPNVGGWNGGRNWLSTRTIIARANYVTTIAEGRLASPVRPPSWKECIGIQRDPKEMQDSVRSLSQLLFGMDVPAITSVSNEIQNQSDIDIALRSAFTLLMRQPQGHLH